MISIVALCVFGMVIFQRSFLPEIKIFYFPMGVLITFQSPPPRTPYQGDVAPYITNGPLLMQNKLVVVPNLDNFSKFLFVI